MRGLDFKFAHHKFHLDASKWNIIHFATFFRQISLLKYFKKLFEKEFGLVWAMSLLESAIFMKDKSDPDIRYFSENSHLYGLQLAIIIKDWEIFEILYERNVIDIEDALILISMCRMLKWTDGILNILASSETKRIFQLCAIDLKIKFVEIMLQEKFISPLLFEERWDGQNDWDQLFVKNIKYHLYQFPYISVSWLQTFPALESDDR